MTFSGPLLLGLTGYPLQHSLSPVLHTAALRACGLEGRYDLFPIAPDRIQDLELLLVRLRQGKLHGLNVTIPHKQVVLPMLDDLTPSARMIRAVNTLYMNGSRLVGDNTDAPGFLADLQRQDAPKSGEALVLGAGGAARAVVAALQSNGWRVSLAARRSEPAFLMQAEFPGLRVMPLTSAGLAAWQPASAVLIVNATSVGMAPHINESPWPVGIPLPAHAFVYDLVYNPAETALLKTARQAGLVGCNGLGMLVEQAALAFERWVGSVGLTLPQAPQLAMLQAVKIQ